MVPMLFTTSSRDMPMPLSDTVRVRACLSKETRILRSASEPYRALSESASKRSLSAASEAFETSSLRKISLLPYKEWIMRLSSCLTSAWKPRVSLVAVVAIANSPRVTALEYGARRRAVQARRVAPQIHELYSNMTGLEFLEPGGANVYAGG